MTFFVLFNMVAPFIAAIACYMIAYAIGGRGPRADRQAKKWAYIGLAGTSFLIFVTYLLQG